MLYGSAGNNEHVLVSNNANEWAALFSREFGVSGYNNSCPFSPSALWSGDGSLCAGSSGTYRVGLPNVFSNITYTWTRSDGGASQSGSSVTLQWNQPGLYYLTCTAKDNTSPTNPTASFTGTVYVVPCNGQTGGCFTRNVSVVAPANNTTFTTATFPFYFDVRTTACDPQGISQIQYNLIDPNGTWFWFGYVDVPNNGIANPYTLTASRWQSLAGSNNAYQITQPGTYRIQPRLFTVTGQALDAQPIYVTIVRQNPGNGGTGGTYNQCFEAENAAGSGTVGNDANASNGQYVGGIGNSSEYRQFSVPAVPSAGTYTLKIRYATGENPLIGIVVNGVLSTMSVPTTQSWGGNYNEVNATVSLNQGNNTIRIQGGGQGGAIVLDRICVQGTGQGPRIGSTESTTADETKAPFSLYPNPATSSVTIECYLEKGEQAVLTVLNATGKETIKQTIQGDGQLHRQLLDTRQWSAGMYLVKLLTERGIEVQKVMINH